ncbi:hypothetical protein PUR28_01290 [Streptomyces sp. BE308]|uniref:hypothetical protein n=1 Tax=Streptomyces sp. BE308 TaxID=3002529 RepID=UPI002E7905AB|nr:hypothetical protein [Streptomyces sp. BE308]MEE1789425.1 hypothetical protein [Streptomyces sp. BE308]
MDILISAPDLEEDRAMDIFEALLEKAGNGSHHLVLGVKALGEEVLGTFEFEQKGDMVAACEAQALHFCDLLEIAVTGDQRGGMVMRTQNAAGESVCGWRFKDSDPQPLNSAEVFDAYCHNPRTGEVLPPEPGVEYKDAPVIHL